MRMKKKGSAERGPMVFRRTLSSFELGLRTCSSGGARVSHEPLPSRSGLPRRGDLIRCIRSRRQSSVSCNVSRSEFSRFRPIEAYTIGNRCARETLVFGVSLNNRPGLALT